jgi:hypothetical protein
VKSILRLRPSPALVIACIALFVSLGGVSYGVATGFIDSREIRNNTISSGDVRNNTLRTFDIRNNEVRGFDIRNSSIQGRDIAFNTLTGADIAEDSLGQVPAAASADSASAVTVLKTIAPTTVAEGAAAVTLATHGPLTLTAVCAANGVSTEARLYVQTTEAGSAGGGEFDDPGIDPGDGPVLLAQVVDAPAAPRTVDDRALFASAPSAKGLTAQFGLISDASGAGSCIFNGHVVLEG